jgi:hypothetical protein
LFEQESDVPKTAESVSWPLVSSPITDIERICAQPEASAGVAVAAKSEAEDPVGLIALQGFRCVDELCMIIRLLQLSLRKPRHPQEKAQAIRRAPSRKAARRVPLI